MVYVRHAVVVKRELKLRHQNTIGALYHFNGSAIHIRVSSLRRVVHATSGRVHGRARRPLPAATIIRNGDLVAVNTRHAKTIEHEIHDVASALVVEAYTRACAAQGRSQRVRWRFPWIRVDDDVGPDVVRIARLVREAFYFELRRRGRRILQKILRDPAVGGEVPVHFPPGICPFLCRATGDLALCAELLYPESCPASRIADDEAEGGNFHAVAVREL